MDGYFETQTQVETFIIGTEACAVDSLKTRVQANPIKSKIGQSSNSNIKTINEQSSSVCEPRPVEKTKGINNLICINSRTEWIEAWP